jgi:hypothetical protein
MVNLHVQVESLQELPTTSGCFFRPFLQAFRDFEILGILGLETHGFNFREQGSTRNGWSNASRPSLGAYCD